MILAQVANVLEKSKMRIVRGVDALNQALVQKLPHLHPSKFVTLQMIDSPEWFCVFHCAAGEIFLTMLLAT